MEEKNMEEKRKEKKKTGEGKKNMRRRIRKYQKPLNKRCVYKKKV